MSQSHSNGCLCVSNARHGMRLPIGSRGLGRCRGAAAGALSGDSRHSKHRGDPGPHGPGTGNSQGCPQHNCRPQLRTQDSIVSLKRGHSGVSVLKVLGRLLTMQPGPVPGLINTPPPGDPVRRNY